jgi:hypothetical protein
MKSIKAQFTHEMTKPYMSTFRAFQRAIWGKKYSKSTISRNFRVLVDIEDYDMADSKSIIDYLYRLSKNGV